MATERKVGLSDWACVSNLSGRKRGNTQRSLPSLPLLCPSTVLSTEARVSAVTHFRPTTSLCVTAASVLSLSAAAQFVPPTFSLASTVGMDGSKPLMLCLLILFLPPPLIKPL